MPKIKWLGNRKNPPPPETIPEPQKRDYIKNMFTNAMREKRITYKTLSDKIGGSPNSLCVKKSNGSERYNIADLFKWCVALDIAEADLLEAVAKSYREAKL